METVTCAHKIAWISLFATLTALGCPAIITEQFPVFAEVDTSIFVPVFSMIIFAESPGVLIDPNACVDYILNN
jgi:hypothetical protein